MGRTAFISWFRAISSPPPGDLLAVVGLLLFSVLVRLPFASQKLINWDAVQFALGSEQFDLARHQPHPPGYIFYVTAAAALNRLTHDTNASLVAISIAAGSVAVCVLYWWARSACGARPALVASLVFSSSPLLWYYSEVALTYAVEVCFALLTLYLLWRSLARGEAHLVVPASVLLGLAGGVRQSTLLLLFPLWLWVVSRHRWQAAPFVALSLTCLAWVLPLIVVSGGVGAYLRDSLELAALVSQATSVVYAGLRAGALNLAIVLGTLGVGLNAALVWMVYRIATGRRGEGLDHERHEASERRERVTRGLPQRHQEHKDACDRAISSCPGGESRVPSPRPPVAPSPRRPFAPSLLWGQAGWERTFTLLWVLPSLLVFTLGHIGQPGYVLLPVPVAYLVLAALLADFEGPRRPSLLSVAILLVAANVGATLGTTELAYQIVPSFAARVDIRENDRYWERLQQLVERYPPAETVVLTGATPRSSFRHAGYYLTEYRVYAIGYDLVGTYGWLFRSYARVSDYHVGGLARSSPSVELPAGARYVFILDEDIAQSLARPYGSVVRQITPHRVVYSVEATGLSGIAFAGDQMHLVSRVLVEAPRSSVTP